MREVRRFPNIWSQLAIVLKLKHVFPALIKKYVIDDIDYEKEHDVSQVRGSFFLVNRRMVEKIGSWDERFFIWFEDVDWCKRAHNAGLRVVYTPRTQCIDYVGQSFKQARLFHKQKYITESMIKYFDKHGKKWEVFLLKAARPFALCVAWILDFKNKKKGKDM